MPTVLVQQFRRFWRRSAQALYNWAAAVPCRRGTLQLEEAILGLAPRKPIPALTNPRPLAAILGFWRQGVWRLGRNHQPLRQEDPKGQDAAGTQVKAWTNTRSLQPGARATGGALRLAQTQPEDSWQQPPTNAFSTLPFEMLPIVAQQHTPLRSSCNVQPGKYDLLSRLP